MSTSIDTSSGPVLDSNNDFDRFNVLPSPLTILLEDVAPIEADELLNKVGDLVRFDLEMKLEGFSDDTETL